MIRSIPCPACKKTVNVPDHIQSVKCSKCGKVWNVQESDEEPETPDAASRYAGPAVASNKKESGGGAVKLIAGVLGGILVLAALGAGGYYWWSNRPTPTAQAAPVAAEPDEDDVVWTPPEYREIAMAEPDRKRIYMDTRAAAIMSIEKPLLLIGPPRVTMEKSLQAIYDRELQTQAALHDISVDDIRQIVNEGDAKKWDERPRSNAKRNGKRIYPKSWSVGWKP